MKFQYFTFFLNPVANLFEDKRDKNEILAEVLTKKEPLPYEHRAVKLAYLFTERYDGYIVGKVGRKSILKRNLPPNQKFEETTEENWPHCEILFNLSKDQNKGQRIAFELKSSVFSSPYEQLKAFSDEINSRIMMSGYAISINPITKEQKFWSIVSENKGKMEKLSLTFNAPNLFNLKNTLTEELKEAQDSYKMTKTIVEFENPDGQLAVPEENDFLKQGVDYITRGGGEYSLKIKGRGRKIISSKDNIETKSFEFDDLEFKTDLPDFIKNLIKQIFD